jgi:hypothetical protein
VDRRLAVDLELFSRGGMKVLEKIERQGYDVLRPPSRHFETGTRQFADPSSAAAGILAGGGRMTLAESYAYCTRVARSRARNFYYSFVLLSRPQRDAICAMYAFMRYCDDLSDDDTTPSAQRRSRGGVMIWMRRCRDDFTGHPVWPAFHDAVNRYGIPHHYFHELIEGVSSDLEPRTIHTFEELYRYCYLVASVVGLTILHIFGFRFGRSAAAGREVRDRLPVDEYSSRYEGRRGARPRVSAGGRSGPFRRVSRIARRRCRHSRDARTVPVRSATR